ncbi:MAG: adenosylcobinamide-GDP ribazoletransferase [Gemmataceae bacterium]
MDCRFWNSASGARPACKAGLFPYSNTMLGSFFAALQFLTVFPPLVRRPFAPAELGRAVGWFPLVGLGLGALLGGLDRLLTPVPPAAAPALLLAAWVIVTGALHLDGFMDTCDGLFGGKSPEDRLAIMRDHHVGAFAVAGCVLLLLLKYTLLLGLTMRFEALLLAVTFGRWSLSLGIVLFPYARDSGLGRDMKDHAGPGQLLLASVVAGLVAWFAGQEMGLLTMGIAGLSTLLLARLVLLRLPGLTGDVYGMLGELSETIALLTLGTLQAQKAVVPL